MRTILWCWRDIGSRINEYIETKLETWLGLELNREKTKVVSLSKPEHMWIFWDLHSDMIGTLRVGRKVSEHNSV